VGKAPARAADVRATMVATLDCSTLIGLRDRTLLVVGFAGAFRRSELVALDVADVEKTDDGLVVQIRRSKTDQEGQGASVGLPFGSDPHTCSVRTLRAWLDAAGIVDGPIFPLGHPARPDHRAAPARRGRGAPGCSGRPVRRARRRPARRPLPARRAHHRGGRGGVVERDIMRHSRHKSVTVLRGYVRDIGLFDANAAAAVGL
jgi:integrase